MWQPQELVGNKIVITGIQPPDTVGELLIFTLSNVSEIIRKITSSTQSWSEKHAAHFLKNLKVVLDMGIDWASIIRKILTNSGSRDYIRHSRQNKSNAS